MFYYSNILHLESNSTELLHFHNNTSKNIAEQKSCPIVKKRLSYEVNEDIIPNINKKKIIIDFPEMNSGLVFLIKHIYHIFNKI